MQITYEIPTCFRQLHLVLSVKIIHCVVFKYSHVVPSGEVTAYYYPEIVNNSSYAEQKEVKEEEVYHTTLPDILWWSNASGMCLSQLTVQAVTVYVDEPC